MRSITIAAAQMACSDDTRANLDSAEQNVRNAAAQGADLVLIQELFEAPYFCKEQHADFFETARPVSESAPVRRMQSLAEELGIVIPVSFFERHGNCHFNSMAMIDADGQNLGVYRKTHIPDGPGYQEKFYFTPGNTGFKVWDTRAGKIGVGICWDQWFPETARCMALMGAEVLLYPTAIGSEPPAPAYDSSDHWQTTMRGHAAANIMPLAAANRIGSETSSSGTEVTFYGRSFISDQHGQLVTEASRDQAELLMATFDLDAIDRERRAWGIFRDRRPSMYGALVE